MDVIYERVDESSTITCGEEEPVPRKREGKDKAPIWLSVECKK